MAIIARLSRVCLRSGISTGLSAIALLFSVNVSAVDIDPELTVDDATQARVELADGSVIFGVLTGFRDDVLTMETSFNDALEIDASLVKNLTSPQSLELMLDDSRVFDLEKLVVTDGELKLSETETIALVDVGIVNPEDWEEGNGYNWTGSTGVALAYNRGNTETDEMDVTFNTVLESLRDRFTVRGLLDQDFAYQDVTTEQPDGTEITTTEKNATTDNWRVLTKYDYFLSNPRNYVGANINFEADEFADINLRSYVGPYFGRKLIEDDDLTLDGEIGLVYVDTDFIEAEDTNYPGMGWNFTGETSKLGWDSRLYLTHVGILNLEDANQVILNTTFGLAFPLVFGLEGAAEIRLDYDGGAAEGKENLDQVYGFRVGYSW